jgi:hypothetical protein
MSGEPAGTLGPHGYLWIEIDGVNYMAQDLAWMYVYGGGVKLRKGTRK